MSGGGGGQEKTEKATPQKLRKARREGQTPRTPDLSAWATVAASAALLPWTIDSAGQRLGRMLAGVGDVAAQPEPGTAVAVLSDGLRAVVVLVAPVALAAVAAAVIGGAVQGGVTVAGAALKPKWNRVNPVTGFKQHYGPMALWQGLQTVIKTGVLVGVTWLAVDGLIPVLLGAGSLPLSSSLDAVRGAISSLVVTSVLVGLVLAVADYVVKRRKHFKDLRMTRQEVKDETKNTEGDPMVKAQRRSRALAMSRNRMMSEVASADAVVVNPTHVAVALRYEADRGAPRVVAKGAGHLAARIRARAREHGVPLVADVPLARSLYAACPVGAEIPGELYGAVAHVLAFLMALRRSGRRGRADSPLVVPPPATRPGRRRAGARGRAPGRGASRPAAGAQGRRR